MSQAVPGPIRRFFDATNAGDTESFLEAFAPDAFLTDWGRDFNGRDEIAHWNETDNIGAKSRLALLSIAPEGDVYRAEVAVDGEGFHGEGTMTFIVDRDRIRRLVIS